MELMFGNTCLSWIRKTLTLQYMCILVGLSQFCSFVLKWFDLVKRFSVKMANTGHFCFQHDTPTPRRRSALLGVELHLGEPEAEFSEFYDLPRCRNPRLGEPLRLGITLLRLGQATVPVLFFLRLIPESVTLLFGLPMEDI